MAPKKPAAEKSGSTSNRPKSGDVSNRSAAGSAKASPDKAKKKVVKKKVVKKKMPVEGAIAEEPTEEVEVEEEVEEEVVEAAPESAAAENVAAEDVAVAKEDAAPAAEDNGSAPTGADSTESTSSAAPAFTAALAKLKETERAARAAYGALPRPISLFSLESLEEEVCAMLENLDPTAISELVPQIATLLDAGSNDFFGGERGALGMRVHTAARSALARTDEGRVGTAEDIAVAEVNSMTRQVTALTSAGYLACCIQLWVPARDGDADELARLLELNPWTVDEPGREGQSYTNALQAACANGHAECVMHLLDAGAIFRDADWHIDGHKPYVCATMLSNAGYTLPPVGQAAGSAERSRVPRETFVQIIDMLLAPSTSFCGGQGDIDLLTETKEFMNSVEPPAEGAVEAAGVTAEEGLAVVAGAPVPAPAPAAGGAAAEGADGAEKTPDVSDATAGSTTSAAAA